MSDYGIQATFPGSVAEAEEAITTALKDVGFGVLTRIDVADTLKKKLDLDRRPYLILGACNPNIASQALDMEAELGLLLPCNVIVYETENGTTMISVIEPEKMLSVVDRDDMQPIAEHVRGLLEQALEEAVK